MSKSDEQAKTNSPSPAAVAAAVAVLAAAWLAAGSVGLLGTPLLRVLSYTALAVAVVLIRPEKRRLAILAATAVAMLGLPLVLGIENSSGYDVLFVVAMASILAGSIRTGSIRTGASEGLDRLAMTAAAWAVAALAVFRIARDSIPAVWHVSNSLGQALGSLAGAISGHSLWLGSSFGGLDFLVVMVSLYVAWLWSTPRPRLRRAIYAASAIAAVQLAYLLLLSQAENLIAALPELPPPPSLDPAEYRPPAWSMAAALRGLIPWNLPLLAMIADLVVVAAMLRWADWRPHETQTAVAESPGTNQSRFAREYLPLALVAVLAAATMTFAPCRSDLSGKKIVAYADADVWALPEHGGEDLSAADAHGMLPPFVAALGGEFIQSESLSETDLAGADVLIMIDPSEPLPEDSLRRVHDFVRGGGSLLLIAGPADEDGHDRRATNAILEPTGMGVRFDIAAPETLHWRGACRPLAHPATTGIDARRNQFGLNLGSSIGIGSTGELGNAGRPLLVGRWGWCESGSDMVTTGMGSYGGGEKLGDVVLAAERPLGRGTVVVMADATALANVSLVYSHPFAGRLLGYLATRGGNPQSWWRQTLGLALLVALVWLVIGRRHEAGRADVGRATRMNRLAVAAAAMAVCLACSTSISRELGAAVPNGRREASRPIAYIDGSHLGISSDEPWTERGIGGFAVTLMRNGYMPLMLHEMDDERLQRAAMLVVIGPSRKFSKTHREYIGRFVDRGGLLVLSIGAERSAANRELLADFGFTVPHSPVAPNDAASEPAPIGRYPEDFGRAFVAYVNAKDYGRGDYLAYTWIHRPWPVQCNADENATDVILRGHEDRPVVIARHREKGCAMVIGDSHFVLNENHGYVDGWPDAGTASNLDFWRWCLGRVTGGHDWFPPDRTSPKDGEPKEEKPESDDPPLQKPQQEDTEQEDTEQENPQQELPDPILPLNPLRSDEVKQ